MGNQQCCSVRSREENRLDKKDVYEMLETLKSASITNNNLDESSFDRLFHDNVMLGRQIFEWLVVQSKLRPVPIEACVNYCTDFLILVQIFISGSDQMLHLISIIQPTEIITQQQAYQIMGLISWIYVTYSIRKSMESQPLELVVQSLFPGQINKLDFVSKVNVYFPHVNKVIKAYFRNRLLQKSFSIKIPKIEKDSFILKYEWLAFLCMSSDMYLHGQLTLLYQSALQAINIQELLSNLQSSSIIICTFADNQNKKSSILLYAKGNWNGDIVGFQLQPIFQIIRQRTVTLNVDSLGYSSDSKDFLLLLKENNSYFQSASRLLTVEIWKCEELQSKLRKTIDEERVSNISQQKADKKRVSFKIIDNPQQSNRSVSAQPVEKIFDQEFEIPIQQPSSPQSPHFRGFNNPDRSHGQDNVPLLNTRVSARPSQQIIEKYSAKQRLTNNNGDLRKSVDDIMRRYEKKV